MVVKSVQRHSLFCLHLLIIYYLSNFQTIAAAQSSWKIDVRSDTLGPQRFLAVDKSAQTFWLLEQQSPLRALKQLPCSTGKESGAKIIRGDLKTPDGVYFVKDRLTIGLDYNLYGDLAFTLNYPNPIDIIMGKTGQGIWIHGRGQPLTPYDTQGCVALNNSDIKGIDSVFERGLPVVLADSLSLSKELPFSTIDTQIVLSNTNDWVTSFTLKSENHFKLYNTRKFSKSQGVPFSSFRKSRRNLFSNAPWVDLFVEDIRIIQGPGYWVSYFSELLRSPAHSSEGVRRLYWQKNEQGAILLVGMEYDEQPLNLHSKYLASKRDDVLIFIEKWRQAWEQGNLNIYIEFYSDSATQGGRRGKKSIIQQKSQLWNKEKAPATIAIRDISISLHNDGLSVDFIQSYTSANGQNDIGKKRLIISPLNANLAILSEEWTSL